MVVAGSLYGLARGLFLRSRQVVFLLIWLAAVLLYLLIPSLQTRYLYMLWPALLMLAAWGLAQAAHDLSRRFWGANRMGLPLVAGATLIAVIMGAGANMRLAPYQTLYANTLAAWLWEEPVLLCDNDLYAAGVEKALLDVLNATAETDSVIGTVLPLRPTAPLSVYGYYGRDGLTYIDLNGLDGEIALDALRRMDYILIPRLKAEHVSPALQRMIDRDFRKQHETRLHGIVTGKILKRRHFTQNSSRANKT